MSKLPMYVIMTVTMGVGGYVPMLFGASAMDVSTILGSVVGGIIGIVVLIKLRQAGYIE